jgi:hypothetical protein
MLTQLGQSRGVRSGHLAVLLTVFADAIAMYWSHEMWKKLAIAGAVGAAILGSGAVALAATGTTSTPGSPVTATATPTATSTGTGPTGSGKGAGGKAAGGGRAAKIALRLRSIEHAEWVAKGKDGDVTHDAVDGLVTAVSPTSIKITAADGFSATFVVNSATKIHVKGGGTAISGVAVNDRALVTGVRSGTSITANRIVDAGPKK